MSNIEFLENLNVELNDHTLREMIFKRLMKEYGRVIQRELKKNPKTLSVRMRDGHTYEEFLTQQLEDVIRIIGEFTHGPSFFEKIYVEHLDDGEFENVTAKNLILTYRYRIESFLYSTNFEMDKKLRTAIEHVVSRLVETPDYIGNFNLQEKHIRTEMIAAVLKDGDDEFKRKASALIEKQSLIVMNTMNEIFVERLTTTLLEEKELKHELIARQKAMDEELKRARKIQRNLLPKSFPSNVGLKFYASYIPMESVGGDFYDIQVFPNPDEIPLDRIGVLIADVSGHGVPAAFIASMAKISWQNNFEQFKTPSAILERLNLQMVENTAGNFLTAFLGVFETKVRHGNLEMETPDTNKRGVFHYASAGHFSPYIIRKDMDSITLKVKGQMLGVFQNIRIEEYSIDYYQGDRFIFYTDGLLEMKNYNGEILGEERLFQIFSETKNLKGNESCSYILEKLWNFSEGKTVEDDITLLIIDAD
ncbi:MAG TPA: PP2C family protein-serine/threonine phosphatase [Leptospiraceae bacterium]|nr:PP2C family protein-serine/threonine phosphatase [Leptospiraceae bacterium]HMW06569.1 PP2C family protein-serine/threonine phosphatase [Leptospiraceae bacterium]HMX32137.1 PP2C family protein-serine/threonine phosphatase [Leptospiraceae bacterium]HMY31240.1 PP2C family protein-serine/threonine phosphatase [Leptospiraceae bacterium]HMZ63273.1 PP2C family protein-serine/threonine phosphatase [Leptospiraceae bacterium]